MPCHWVLVNSRCSRSQADDQEQAPQRPCTVLDGPATLLPSAKAARLQAPPHPLFLVRPFLRPILEPSGHLSCPSVILQGPRKLMLGHGNPHLCLELCLPLGAQCDLGLAAPPSLIVVPKK